MNIENLEPRVLLSTTFVFAQNGTQVVVTGSDSTVAAQADQIEISQASGKITVTDIRTGESKTSTGTVNSIVIDLRAGDDYVRLRKNDGSKPVIINSTIFGGLGNDTIYGGDVNDNLSGGDGNDKIQGRGGSDGIDGGAGFDTVDYSYETHATSLSLDDKGNDGIKDIFGNGTNVGELDFIQSTIEAIVGGTGNDLIVGNGSANAIDGGAGNDLIAGRGGNDTLTGGVGLDTVFGEDGNDFLFTKDSTLDLLNDGAGTDSAQIDSTAAGDKVTDAATAAAPPANPAIVAALLRAAVSPNLSPSAAQPGDLDQTFGTSGFRLSAAPFNFVTIHKAIMESIYSDFGNEPSQKLLLVGSASNDPQGQHSQLLLLRLNLDGTLDTSFGDGNGYVTTDLSPTGQSTDVAYSVLIDTFQRIVVVGSTTPDDFNSDGVIARYNRDGSLDSSFGNSSLSPGTLTFDDSDGGDDVLRGIVLQGGESDQYIVAGSSGSEAVITRYFDDGSQDGDYDHHFNNGGMVQYTDLKQDQFGYVYALADGTTDSGNPEAYLNVFDSSGSPHGSTQYSATSADVDFNALLISGNQLIVAGKDTHSGETDGLLMNYTISYDEGAVELTQNGVRDVANDSGLDLEFNGLTSDGPGRGVAIGFSDDGTQQFMSLYRFNLDTLAGDATFTAGDFNSTNSGTAGLIYLNPAVGFAQDDAVLTQPDGKLLVAGGDIIARYTGGADLAAHSPSDLDTTFGPNLDGLSIQTENFDLHVSKVLMQGDKIVVIGTMGNYDNFSDDFFVMRFNTDGSLDTTFGTGGLTLTDFSTPDAPVTNMDQANDATIDLEGRIIVVGQTQTYDGEIYGELDSALARYTADGILDTSFGPGDTSPAGTEIVNRASGHDDYSVGVTVTDVAGASSYVIFGDQLYGSGSPDSVLDLWRIDVDGNFVSSLLNNNLGVGSTVRAVAVTQDDAGHILELIKASDPSSPDSAWVIVLEQNGTTDVTGLDSTNLVNFGGSVAYTPTSFATRGDEVVVAGTVDNDGSLTGALIRMTVGPSDGQISDIRQSQVSDFNDLSFTDVAFDADGRAVAVGYESNNFGDSFAVYRFQTSDLTGDSSFSHAGEVASFSPAFATQTPGLMTTSIDDSSDGQAIAIQPDGKIVVAGESIIHSEGDIYNVALARYYGGNGIAENVITGDIPPETLQTELYYINPDNPADPTHFALPGYLFQSFLAQTVGPLTINGTQFDDSITLQRTVDESGNEIIRVDVDGDVRSYDPSYITGIIVNGNGGHDNVRVINTLGLGHDGESIDLSITGGENRFTFQAQTQTDTHGNTRDQAGQSGQLHGTFSAPVFTDNGTPEDTPSDGIDQTADDGYVVTYTPETNYIGGDDFTYDINKSEGGTDTQVVHINLTQTNVAPTAGNDALTSIAEDSGQRTIAAATLFANDSVGPAIENAQMLKIIGLDNIVGGTATILSGGDVAFTPFADYNGPAGFSYTVTDNGTTDGLDDPFTATANVSFTVTPVNDPPIANAGGPYAVTAGSSIPLAGSATDVDNDVLTYQWDLNNNGIFGEASTAQGNENGATPTFNSTGLAAGPFTVKLRVSDGHGGIDNKTTTVTINAANTSTKLIGTVIGSAGTSGHDAGKAFDGDPNTYYQPKSVTGLAYIGLDFGANKPKTITQIRILPKQGTNAKLLAGFFQGSNDSNFNNATTLYTVLSVANSGWTTFNINNPNGFRYVRFVGLLGSNYNVAELEFYGKTPAPDIIAPTKPGKPQVTSNTYTSIKLKWSASTDASGVKGYNIFRNGQKIGTTTDTTFSDANLTPGTQYTYTVQAFDAANNTSVLSDVLTASTVKDTTPPSKPGTPKKGSVTKTTIALTWSTSSDNVGIKRYDILRNGVVVGTSLTGLFTDSGLVKNTGYTYVIRAVDTSNNLSALSGALNAKTST